MGEGRSVYTVFCIPFDILYYLNKNHWDLLGGPVVKTQLVHCSELGFDPWVGNTPPEEGKGYPLQYSSLENSMDYSPWGLKESGRTEQLSLH